MIKEMLDNKIEVEYIPPKDKIHYEITPYTFAPKVAKRLISKTYLDLNQGILECIQSAYKRQNPSFVYDGFVVDEKKSL